MATEENLESIDINHDGILDKKEYTIYEQRAKNRRRMAWVALISLIVTAFSIMFVVPESRIERISSALELYWIALGGVVGAYVGISSWTRRG
jgi:NADH:ubiquinone oxidoreductase subunit E